MPFYPHCITKCEKSWTDLYVNWMRLDFVFLELMIKYLLAGIARGLGPVYFNFVDIFSLHDLPYIWSTVHLLTQKIMWWLLYVTIIVLIII